MFSPLSLFSAFSKVPYRNSKKLWMVEKAENAENKENKEKRENDQSHH
jgi:hypothetical protein